VEQKPEIVRMLADRGIGDPEVSEAREWISVMVKVKSKK
jgi:hypothetical protein